jgi:hypothetical protein
MRTGRQFSRWALLCVLFCFTGCAFLPGGKARMEESSPPAANEPGGPEATPAPAPVKEQKSLRWQDIVFFWWPKKKPGPPVAAPLQTAAVVSFVNLPANFVILESPSATSQEEGTVLSSLEDGRIKATIRVTPDRRPPFIIAEIIEGVPERGDRFHAVVLD